MATGGRLIETAAAIAEAPPARIDFLHTVLAQCGLPHRNPAPLRHWERRQGAVTLRVNAGEAIDPRTGQFLELGLPYGEKPRARSIGGMEKE